MRVGWSWWSLRDTGSPLGLLRFTLRVGTLNVTISVRCLRSRLHYGPLVEEFAWPSGLKDFIRGP